MLDKLLKKSLFYNIYLAILFVMSLVVVITEQQIAGAVIFGCIAALSLILFSDLTVFLTPTLLLSVFVTVCYDSYSTFIKFVPLAVPLAFCVIFNLIKYRAKPKLGSSFKGTVAVAIAVTLGGFGTLSAKSYFAPTSLFYVFMLGGGMILLYLLFSSRITEKSGRMLIKAMYAVGMLASFIICFFYFKNWEEFVNSFRFLNFTASNNLSTFIMMAMPFPMLYARKRHIDVLATLFMYLCIVMSSSRGGLVMGTVEMLVIFIAYTFFFEKSKIKKVLYTSVFIICVLTFFNFLPELVIKVSYKSLSRDTDSMTLKECFDILKQYFINPEEPRARVLKRSIGDFLSNPVFGVGLGYTGNSDIYSPKTGAMNWYHIWTAQVFGGLGIVGILAYCYQLVLRTVIYFKNASPVNMTFFVSYIGLWLMSQLNPGEFCPIPYALLATVYFIIIERKKHEDTKTDSRVQGLHMGRKKASRDIR